jgi:hypothetical protein
MNALTLFAFAAVLVALVSRLRLDLAFGVVALSLLLVPAYLLLPISGFSGSGITRITFIAFAVSFVRRTQTGEVDREALHPPRLLLGAILGFLVIGAVGVGLSSDELSFRETATTWLIYLDQAVMLWIGVVVTRTVGARRVADVLIAALAAAVAIGAWEHLSGSGWSQLFPVTDASARLLSSLEDRGGTRVRSGALFALEFGWVIVVLIPLVVERAWSRVPKAWRIGLVVLFGASATVVVWTRSRSALVAVGVTAAVFVGMMLLSAGFRRRPAWPAVAGLMLVGVLVVTTDFAGDVFDIQQPAQSTGRDVRLDRLPGILEETAERPAIGLGLGGLRPAGYVTPDNGWVLLYASSGVIGLAVYATLVVLALVTAGMAMRAPPGPDRYIAVAVTVGMLAWVVANASYDASNLGLSGPLFWLLAGVGLAMAERVTRPLGRSVPPAAVVGGAVTLLALSVVVALASPSHVARRYQFQDLPTTLLARTSIGYETPAYRAEATVCEVMDALSDSTSNGRIDCVHPGVYQPNSGAYSVQVHGVGRMRTEARSVEALDDLESEILSAADAFVHFELIRLSADERGRRTAARTAPVWTGVAIFFVLQFWPRRRPEGTGAVDRRSIRAGAGTG